MVNFSTISGLTGITSETLTDSTANPTFWQNLGGVLGNLGKKILTNTANTALDKATGGMIGTNQQIPYGTPPIIPQNNTPIGLIIGAVVGLVLLIFKKKK